MINTTRSERIACNLCRHRKIRCDRAKPACETCHLAGVPCVFTRLQPKKSVREQLEESKAHVRRLEHVLRDDRGSSASSSAPTPLIGFDHSWTTSIEAFRWHLQFCNPTVVGGGEFAEIFNFEDFVHQMELSQSPSISQVNEFVSPRWPPRSMIHECIESFSRNRIYSVFPIVDLDALRYLANTTVLEQGGSLDDFANKACLVAFTAFISRIRQGDPNHETAFTYAAPDAYMQVALSLIPQLMIAHSNVRALEAIMILALYIAPLGQPQTAEMLLSMAARILFNLGGHTNRGLSQTQSPGQVERHKHLRELFWLCYAMDKEMCLRKCKPPLINDADCDLDLPPNYVSISSNQQFFLGQPSADELLFPSDIRMALLQSKIYHNLFSHQSLTRPISERLQLIREMDHELNELKSQFPVIAQPERFLEGNIPNTLFHDLSLRGINFHLGFYHCLTKIHQASLIGLAPIKGWSPPSSSLELCYEAARSTLLYIHRVRNLVIKETFWIYAQFILTAVLALYRRLVTDRIPLATDVDYQILVSIVDMFAGLKMADTANEFTPFAIMHSFLERLVDFLKE